MKKRKPGSIFLSTIATLLPIVLLSNLIVLGVAYYVVYEHNYKHCVDDVAKAAKVIEDYVGIYDLNDPEDVKVCNESISALCREFEITYSYVVEVNVEKNSETYIVLGAGKDAAESFLRERHSGDTVVGYLNQAQIDVAIGKKDCSVLHEKTVFDDTIICYVPLKHVYDEQQKTFVETESNNRVVAAEISFNQMIHDFRQNLVLITVITFVLSTGIVVAFATVLRHRVAKPIEAISRQMSNYVAGESDSIQLDIKGHNELTEMAGAFHSMVDEINRYIRDIHDLNKQKHIQEAEMNIAKSIQLGLLPHRFYSNAGVNIDATILPARDVGGDFYDYKILADGKVAFAVADVSGKGVSAALFVSRALTLLETQASIGNSPAKTMEHYNNALSEHNPGKLFITTFVGVYNPADRTLVYTNAGHNVPYILSENDIIPLDGAVGMAAGVFPGAEYEEQTVTLKEGDVLFVYTDGVNEAQNVKEEFFTIEGLETQLKAHTGENRKYIIEDVLAAVESFSEGAVQSDDITMFTLKAAGAFYHKDLHLSSDVNNLSQINEVLENIPQLPPQLVLDLNLMAEEIFVNLCAYAYTDKTGEIDVSINVSEQVVLTFTDSGTPYNPTRNVLDIEEYDHEHTVGGLGKFITFRLADEYHYEYRNGKNILTLVKKVNR